MRVVLVHPRAPGQFAHLARHLPRLGWDVTMVCETADRRLPGVRVVRQRAERGRRGSPGLARHLAVPEHHVRIGYRTAETLERLAQASGRPDAILGHIGWGSLLFAKDVLPDVPAIGYCEYFFRGKGGDVGFDPAEPASLDDRQRLRLRNTAQLLTLDAIEAGMSPTRWQRSRYPAALRPRIGVCHDGIDTGVCRPDPAARLRLPDGRTIAAGDPVVTYAARDLEPYRGFPQFMHAAARVAGRRPDALFLVAGRDGVSYGRPRLDGRSWRAALVEEAGVPPDRIVFLGSVPHATLVRLFQVSAAHVYLTYPFVLSWSVLEAMACGALVVGSDTAPVREVVRDGVNGLLADFFDPDAIASRIVEALDGAASLGALRKAARETVTRRFDLAATLARQTRALERIAGG